MPTKNQLLQCQWARGYDTWACPAVNLNEIEKKERTFKSLRREFLVKSRGTQHGRQKDSKILVKNLPQPALDIHLNALQKQTFSSNLERNSYQPYDIKLRNKVSFDIQTTNPQADIVATGRWKFLIIVIDFMKYQSRKQHRISLRRSYTPRSVHCHTSLHLQHREILWHAYPERFKILRAFEKAKYSGLHNNIHPTPLHQNSLASYHTQRCCYLQTYKPKDQKLVRVAALKA